MSENKDNDEPGPKPKRGLFKRLFGREEAPTEPDVSKPAPDQELDVTTPDEAGALAPKLPNGLLQTRDRIDSDALPLTQEFLSQMLGVQRTTVTLVARQLEQAGLIQNGRGRIVIVDRKGLEDECYAKVRDQSSAALPEPNESRAA